MSTNDPNLKFEKVFGGCLVAVLAVVMIVSFNWQSIRPIFDDKPSASASELASSSARASESRAANAAAAAESSARQVPDPSNTYTPPTAAAPGTASGSGSTLDGAFAQTLLDYDIDVASASGAVSTAKAVCRLIGNSPDPSNAILAASEIAQKSGGYTRSEANDFVGIAVAAYCPDYSLYVQN